MEVIGQGEQVILLEDI
jgi:hypothetical protein